MTMIFRYRVFGKVFTIEYAEELAASARKSLQRQMSYYPAVKPDTETDVTISLRNDFTHRGSVVTDSCHEELADGFVVHFIKWSISYRMLDSKPYCEVILKKEANPLLRFFKKLYNIECLSPEERLRQIVTENVLLPVICFFSGKALIHCAAVCQPEGKALLIGGSGGTGKTSLSLELCRNRGYSFICDDMSVISAEGSIYPNLAFPKIYAYNTRGKKELKGLIRQRLSGVIYPIWYAKRFLLGDNKVRVSFSPDELYPDYCTDPVTVSRYFILSANASGSELTCRKAERDKAAESTINIIEREYADFFSHLKLHESFCNERNKTPLLSYQRVRKEWQNTLFSALKKIDLYAVDIPGSLSHREIQKKLRELIL